MQPKTASPANRRLDPRRAAKGWTKVKCHKGTLEIGANIAVSVLDIAETGIRLVVRNRLDSHQEVNFTVESPSSRRPLALAGRVIWCVETADKNFCVGVQFNKRLSYTELTRIS